MNYGNRLQNYATQRVFEKMGFEVETILNCLNYKARFIKNIIKRLIPIKRFKRYNNFMKFNKKIKYSKHVISDNRIPIDINSEYDYFFTGSDQVWNPNFKRTSNIDFLEFADEEKRNSISASFGVSTIPQSKQEYYKNMLMKIKNISVREERGKEIIKELTGRDDISVLTDPTMLLEPDEWMQVEKKPIKHTSKKYIFTYFLGELSNERKEEIERVARENECEIINFFDLKSSYYTCGPSEFIYLERNAFLICTDSFHSTVFSILFDRPFVIFDREDKSEKMNSRLDTLLKKFNVDNRWYKGKITQEMLNFECDKKDEILKMEREKADRFLKKALDIKEN